MGRRAKRGERNRKEWLHVRQAKASEARAGTAFAIAFGTVSDTQQALRYEAQCWDYVGHLQDREKQALISHIKHDLLTAADALDGRPSPHLDESNAGIFHSYEWCLADAVAKMKQSLGSP
jgi:hypothetical protein